MAKKSSTQDFLNLLDDEATAEKVVFQPKATKPSVKVVVQIGRHKLSPIQKELLNLFLTKTPILSRVAGTKFVHQWMKKIATFE